MNFGLAASGAIGVLTVNGSRGLEAVNQFRKVWR